MIMGISEQFPELVNQHASPSSVPAGWTTIITDMLTGIRAVCKEEPTATFQILQIKEKFGQLRVYYRKMGFSTNNDKILVDLISHAESLADTTCDVCGEPGTLGHDGVMAVRCEKHKKFHWSMS
jgi:hypothetical protein